MNPVLLLVWLPFAVGYQKYCKCSCSEKTVVAEIDLCILCTNDWCLGQNADLCEKTKEVLNISCFQRESGKEFTIVLMFVILVLCLLGYKIIRAIKR